MQNVENDKELHQIRHGKHREAAEKLIPQAAAEVGVRTRNTVGETEGKKICAWGGS